MKLLSKRAATTYETEFAPNFYNEENAKDYKYTGWHDQRLYEETDSDRYKNNPYEILNNFNITKDLAEDILEQKEKNKTWTFSQMKY